jgi:hypothetical protein
MADAARGTIPRQPPVVTLPAGIDLSNAAAIGAQLAAAFTPGVLLPAYSSLDEALADRAGLGVP